MKDTDEYDTGRDHGHAVQDAIGTGVDYLKKGWTATLDGIGSGVSWLWDSKAGKYVRGTTRGMVDGTWVGDKIDTAEAVVDTVQREGEAVLRERGMPTVAEDGRLVYKNSEQPTQESETTPAPEETVATPETEEVERTTTPASQNRKAAPTPTSTTRPASTTSTTRPATTTSTTRPVVRGDALLITYRNQDGTEGRIFLNSDQVKMVRAFALGEMDAENGFKLKVVEDADSTALSNLYYEPDEVVGSDYRRKGTGAKQRLSFANTAFTLTNSQYHAALQKIYELERQAGQVNTPFQQHMMARYQQGATTFEQNVNQTAPAFTPHTPHNASLKVNFIIPGTNTNSMVVLSAEQVEAVRAFIRGKRDVHGGFKLLVTGNAGEPFSPLYYQLNKQGNAYVRRGEDPSSVAVASSVSTFKLNETQFHAAALGIMKADAERGYVDPDMKKWHDAMFPQQPTNVQAGLGANGLPMGISGPVIGQVGQNGQILGTNGQLMGQVGKNGQILGTNGQLIGQVGQNGFIVGANGQVIGQMGANGQIIGVAGTGTTTTADDDKNFFLSAGNWINGAFDSLANMIPISLISKFLKMIGNCIAGLFKTIGYVLEGEWGKAGTELFGWLKDAAIVGGVAYGAYFLKNKISEYFKDDDKSTTSSNSSSTNTNTSTGTSSNTNSDLADLLAGILNNSSNSSNSGNSNSTNNNQGNTDKDVYVGLNHSSNGQVAGTVTTFTDSSGTTQRLLNTSDRFLLAGEIRDPDSDGTLWRVKVDKTK